MRQFLCAQKAAREVGHGCLSLSLTPLAAKCGKTTPSQAEDCVCLLTQGEAGQKGWRQGLSEALSYTENYTGKFISVSEWQKFKKAPRNKQDPPLTHDGFHKVNNLFIIC